MQRNQVIEVAAVERHLLQLRPIDSARHAPLLGLDQRRRRGHGHVFGDAGHLECEIDAAGLADSDVHRVAPRAAKSLQLYFDAVGAGAEAEHTVAAVVRADDVAHLAGGDVGDGDRGAGHDAALAVGHDPHDGAVELGARRERRKNEGEQEGCCDKKAGSQGRHTSLTVNVHGEPFTIAHLNAANDPARH